MRFLFLPTSVVPFTGKSLEERPLGGTETGIIRLAAALDERGHDVTVLTPVRNPPLSKPLYLPLSKLNDLRETDVLVVVREWMPLFCHVKAKRRLFWTGDAGDQQQTVGLGDRRIIRRVDGLLAVSEWQAETLSAASGFPRDKAVVIRNGIEPGYFLGSEPRNTKRLMYSSTPFRGLALMPSLFAAIKARVPEAELSVFSGYDVYADKPGGTPAGYEGLMKELEQIKSELAKVPGISYSSGIPQAALAREFMRSAVLAYPNTFAETSCITVMEAQRAGCVPLTSNCGALPETVGNGGVLIEGKPGTPQYDTAFIETAIRLLTDVAYWQSLSDTARRAAQNATWAEVAARLERFLLESGINQSAAGAAA